jgi:hypothetical protein
VGIYGQGRWPLLVACVLAAACSGAGPFTAGEPDASEANDASSREGGAIIIVSPGHGTGTSDATDGASEGGADAGVTVEAGVDAMIDGASACSTGSTCTTAHATASSCDAFGSCAETTCDPGYLDCDGNAYNGCETAFSLPNCGACGANCSPQNVGTAICSNASGGCTYDACVSQHLDCDGNRENGCETACTPTNVVAAACAGTRCGYTACATGFLDCDGNTSNGCETPMSLANCGACGRACAPSNATGASCSTAGVCAYTACMAYNADELYLDCDGNTANGCETDPTTGSNCGRCGNACAPGFDCIDRGLGAVCKND